MNYHVIANKDLPDCRRGCENLFGVYEQRADGPHVCLAENCSLENATLFVAALRLAWAQYELARKQQ